MKALKIVGVLVLFLVIGIGGVVFYSLSRIDSIIINAVEKYGSEAVGTQVTLRGVDVDFGRGRIELNGFEVANPPGYDTDYAFALNKIIVQILPESVTSGVIVVKEITIDQPSVIAEEKGLSTTNLTELANNLNSGAGGAEENNSDSSSMNLPNIAVELFNFSKANISLVSEQYGDRTINMPSFTAKNLGGSNGLPPDQLAAVLMEEVIDQASSAVKRATRDAAREEVRDRAKEAIDEKLSDDDKEKLESLKNIFNR